MSHLWITWLVFTEPRNWSPSSGSDDGTITKGATVADQTKFFEKFDSNETTVAEIPNHEQIIVEGTQFEQERFRVQELEHKTHGNHVQEDQDKLIQNTKDLFHKLQTVNSIWSSRRYFK